MVYKSLLFYTLPRLKVSPYREYLCLFLLGDPDYYQPPLFYVSIIGFKSLDHKGIVNFKPNPVWGQACG